MGNALPSRLRHSPRIAAGSRCAHAGHSRPTAVGAWAGAGVRRSGFVWCVVATLLVAWSAIAAPSSTDALTPPGEGDRWLRLQVAEFVIYSNGSAAEATSIAEHLQLFRAALGRLTALKVSSPLPIRVYAFRDAASFAPYRDLALTDPALGVLGLCLPKQDGLVLLLDAGGEWGREHLLFEGLVNTFIANTGQPIPAWLRAGLADFYSAFEVSKSRISFGLPKPGYLLDPTWRTSIPLRKVLEADDRSRFFADPNTWQAFNAEAWTMTHYLLMDCPQRKGQLTDYLGQLEAGRSVADAFLNAFSTTPEAFAGELDRYVSRGKFRYLTLRRREINLEPVGEPVPMKRDEALGALGSLLAEESSRALVSADCFLTDALAVNPDNIGALTALGLVRERQGQPDKAWELYDAALAHRPDRVRAYLIPSLALLKRLRGENPPARADVERARGLLRELVKLAPGYADAWAWLGHTYVQLPESDATPGIEALERSLALSAEELQAASDLVVLCTKAGRRDRARVVFGTRLLHCSDRGVVQPAREALLAGDLDEAEALLRDGLLDEADEAAKQVIHACDAFGASAAIKDRAIALQASVAAARRPTNR